MRLPDDMRKCVAFLGYQQDDGGIHIGGTCFFMAMSSEAEPSWHYQYLVTAEHVVEQIAGRPAFVRVNRPNGESKDVPLGAAPDWHYHRAHEDNAGPWVDVAVLRWEPKDGPYDYLSIPPDYFADPTEFGESVPWGRVESIGPGDEVSIVGLFSLLVGKRTNLPIVRTGHIAMLPTEMVPVKRYPKSKIVRDMEAYLIEARSIGGFSGSPVFVRPTVRAQDGSLSFGGLRLLGLVHGHWDIEAGTVVDATQTEGNESAEDETSINVGVAVVVPLLKIWETLYRQELREARAKEDRTRDWENSPTPDTILPPHPRFW